MEDNGEAKDHPPWKKVHEMAVAAGKETYDDPATGYSVFTTLAHRNRGYCCGNTCRHCPYDNVNVGNPAKLKREARAARAAKRAAKVADLPASDEDEDENEDEGAIVESGCDVTTGKIKDIEDAGSYEAEKP